MSNDTVQRVKFESKSNNGIKFGICTMVLMLFCCFMLVICTFLQLNVTHFIIPEGLFSGDKIGIADFLYTYKFIPQVPVVLFIGALLGRKYGIACIVLYILAGLFFVPIFALGGGLKYIGEYGFGYILAYIPAVFFAGSILRSGFSNRNLLHAAVVGVLTIHVIGILYMFMISLIRNESWAFMQSWIVAQSGMKIIYDLIFSFFTLFVARYARLLIWAYI